MTRRLPTASGLDRADLCPASEVVRHAPFGGPDAAHGRRLHAFLDAARRLGREGALREVTDPEDQRAFSLLRLDRIPRDASTEVALRYNPWTEEADRMNLLAHRRYPEVDHNPRQPDIYGTLDMVGITGPEWPISEGFDVGEAQRIVYVGDYKSGRTTREADKALQLRFGALASARMLSADGAFVEFLVAGRNGAFYLEQAFLDSWALQTTAADLRELAARILRDREAFARDRTAVPTFRMGENCKFCPGQTFCPALASRVRLIAQRDRGDWTEELQALPAAEAGAAYEEIIRLEHLVKAAKSVLRERCVGGEVFPLSGGAWEYRKIDAREWHKTETAAAELSALKDSLRERGELYAVMGEKVQSVRTRIGKPRIDEGGDLDWFDLDALDPLA